MITAFYGSTVQLFDLEKNVSIGESIRTAGDGEVGFVNNEIAYTADWESMRLWDTSSGKQIGDPIQHELREDTIIPPAVSPMGKLIATRTSMDSVEIRDIAQRQLVGKTRKYSSEVHSIRFSKDGGFLMVRAGGSIYAIDPATGKDVAGPIPSGWLFEHFSKQQKLVTTEEAGEGKIQLVIRSTAQKGWPETHRSDLPGKLKRIVALDKDRVLLQATNQDYTPEMFIISLEKPKNRDQVDSDADRAFGVVIPQDKRLWICSNIRNISCQEFGKAKPLWEKPIEPSGYDQRLFPFNNDYFVILDKKNNFGIYKIADGSEVWMQAGVNRFMLTENKIALCNGNGVEIWKIK